MRVSAKRLVLNEKFDDVMALLSDFGYEKMGESISIERDKVLDKTFKLQVEEIENRVNKFCGYLVNEIITDDLMQFITKFFGEKISEDYVHSLNEILGAESVEILSALLFGRCQALVSINLAKVLTGLFSDMVMRGKWAAWRYISRQKREEIEKNATD